MTDPGSERRRGRDVHRLAQSRGALVAGYDLAMLDLDGVVYRGQEAIAGSPEAVARIKECGLHVAFVTNNAARPPSAVGRHLRSLGIDAADGDVVTSAQAAARLVADRVPRGAKVLVVGGEGLRIALEEHGLLGVDSLAAGPEAVVQGFHPEVGWTVLAEAAYAVAAGLPWVASNMDRTIPTARGVAPGNGTLVAAVMATTEVRPVVAGKPEPALFDETLLRVGGSRPLVIGDRLDTDIAGANRVSADSLLVLTGVTDLSALAAAAPADRPTFVAADLDGLWAVHAPVVDDGEGVRCAGWRCVVENDRVTARLSAGRPTDGGPVAATPVDAGPTALLRAAVSAAWARQDRPTATSTRPELEMSAVRGALDEIMEQHRS